MSSITDCQNLTDGVVSLSGTIFALVFGMIVLVLSCVQATAEYVSLGDYAHQQTESGNTYL